MSSAHDRLHLPHAVASANLVEAHRRQHSPGPAEPFHTFARLSRLLSLSLSFVRVNTSQPRLLRRDQRCIFFAHEVCRHTDR